MAQESSCTGTSCRVVLLLQLSLRMLAGSVSAQVYTARGCSTGVRVLLVLPCLDPMNCEL